VAERANRGKDEFLAMLGHELRNPLSAITAAVEVINRVGPQENAAQSARRIIGRQTQQLVGLMNDLTDIARIGAGKARLTRQRINLARLVWRTQAALRLAGRFHHHSLGLELQQAWIEVDAMRIEQVIGNLLTNATKYTPPGGHITLSLRVIDHEAEIRVADDGVGMSRTLLERVFDVFVQGERSPQSQGGLGLGLALVRRLVELHGGTVHAASAGQDLGSCFTVRLPGAESPADGATFARPLLIVAPGPEALGAVESLVEEAACDVTLVPTPDDVERCLARVNPRPALLLVDGCEVDAHTLAHWKTVSPGLRVGVLGAVDGPGEVPPIDWVETGFDTLVAHPLHLRNLLEEEASDTPA
jgi:two-component sensor histidine kinase